MHGVSLSFLFLAGGRGGTFSRAKNEEKVNEDRLRGKYLYPGEEDGTGGQLSYSHINERNNLDSDNGKMKNPGWQIGAGEAKMVLRNVLAVIVVMNLVRLQCC